MSKYLSTMLLSMAVVCTAAQAAPSQDGAYSPFTKAASGQAKVVVYRGDKSFYAPHNRADVDLNGDEFVARILSNQHTVFCVKSGKQVLGSHLEDTLIYNSKNRQEAWVTLEAGKTYIYKVMDDERTITNSTILVPAETFQRESTTSVYVEANVGKDAAVACVE